MQNAKHSTFYKHLTTIGHTYVFFFCFSKWKNIILSLQQQDTKGIKSCFEQYRVICFDMVYVYLMCPYNKNELSYSRVIWQWRLRQAWAVLGPWLFIYRYSMCDMDSELINWCRCMTRSEHLFSHTVLKTLFATIRYQWCLRSLTIAIKSLF